MSAADAWKPGDRPPLENLMDAMDRSIWGNRRNNSGGRRGINALLRPGYDPRMRQALLQLYKFFISIKKHGGFWDKMKEVAKQWWMAGHQTSKGDELARTVLDLGRLFMAVVDDYREDPEIDSVRRSMIDFLYGDNDATRAFFGLQRFADKVRLPQRDVMRVWITGGYRPQPPKGSPWGTWAELDLDIRNSLDASYKAEEEDRSKAIQVPRVDHPGPESGEQPQPAPEERPAESAEAVGPGSDGQSGRADTGAGREGDSPSTEVGGSDGPESDGKGGGLTLPGYRYVGPGNPLDAGEPRGPVDAIAKKHDERYDELIKHGHIPYIHGRGADTMMGKELADAEEAGKILDSYDQLVANAARGLWRAKDTLADLIGGELDKVLPPDPPVQSEGEESQKRPREEADPPESADSAPKAPPAQKPRLDVPEYFWTEEEEGAGDGSGDDEGGGIVRINIPIKMESADSTQHQPQGHGGGPRASGHWRAGTMFGTHGVTTTQTRMVILSPKTDYKPLFLDADTSKFDSEPGMGFLTPWQYFDFNCYMNHFTPSDWQELGRRYDSIRPKSLTIAVENVVIKDVHQTNNETNVHDSGTGGIMIFEDSDYTFPYVIGHAQEGNPGALSIQWYNPPQYAYFTGFNPIAWDHATGTTKYRVHPSADTEFFVLEEHAAQILRSGDATSFAYEFPSLEPKRLGTRMGTLNLRHNPVLPSRLAIYLGEDSSNGPTFYQPQGTDLDIFPQGFIPGPRPCLPVSTQLRASSDFDEMSAIAYGDPTSNNRHSLMPFTRQATTMSTQSYNRQGEVQRNVHFQLGDMAFARSSAEDSFYERFDEDKDYRNPGGYVKKPRPLVTAEREGLGERPGDALMVPTWGAHLPGSSTGPGITKTEKVSLPFIPPMPGACWDERPLCYEDDIWCKKPYTDCSFMSEKNNLGAWALVDPPPQVFFRMQPQVGPPPADLDQRTFLPPALNQYAMFTVSYTMEWVCEPRKHTRRHNLEPPAPMPYTESGDPPFLLTRSHATNDYPRYSLPVEAFRPEGRAHRV